MWNKGDQTCGRMPNGPYIRKTASPQWAMCEVLFRRKQHSSDRTSQWDFFLLHKVKSVLSKEPGWGPWKQWKQKWRSSDTWSTSNTGHGQTNHYMWMKLCIAVARSTRVNALPSPSSKLLGLSNKINSVSLLSHLSWEQIWKYYQVVYTSVIYWVNLGSIWLVPSFYE